MTHSPIPFTTLQDYQRVAEQTLSPAAWSYFHGGAGDELTCQANLTAWQNIGLSPRVLRPLHEGHTHRQLFGQFMPRPWLVAPMAWQRWAHPAGEAGMALAAAAQGCGFILSHQTTTPLQDIAPLILPDPTRGPLWFQLYWMSDRQRMLALVHEIEAAGYEALVLTVDAPIQGVRDRARQHSGSLPPGMQAVHWSNTIPHLKTGLCDGWGNQAPTWDNLAWLIEHTSLPVLIKGITHPDDAQQAVLMGVAGIIVSNHGGRVLDTVPATASLLPAIKHRVGEAIPLLIDGGIRRGTDIFKALALGAQAVLIGRPCLYGLACAGAQGVAHVLRMLRDEFEAAMVLTGCATLSDIEASHIRVVTGSD